MIWVATIDLTIGDVLGRIPCPWEKCRNHYQETSFEVDKHLYHHGFVDGYVNWTFHGEERWRDSASTIAIQNHVKENKNLYVDMVTNVVCGRLNPEAVELEEDPNPSTSKVL